MLHSESQAFIKLLPPPKGSGFPPMTNERMLFMKRKCDFCGKTKEENNIDFFVSRGSVICSECVEKCWTLKNKKIKTVNQETQTDRMRLTPKKIMSYLNEYIVGQEEAKKTLSVAVYNHLKTMNNPNIKKSNVLVLGPTGSGKTYLAETLSHIVNLPFAIADATTLTEAGYVGDDVHSILLKLIHAANNDIKQAEKGIVYIDEIDKIAKKGEGRDISGEGVQQALLKMMEGCLVTIPGDKERKTIMINTNNILFICGGAFSGLKKKNIKKGIGFSAELVKTQEEKITASDLIDYGFSPEFIGRMPIITTVKAADVSMLRRILTEPKNSLTWQYIELMKMDNVELSFSEKTLNMIAAEAYRHGSGARGLRSVMEEKMKDIMFEIPEEIPKKSYKKQV